MNTEILTFTEDEMIQMWNLHHRTAVRTAGGSVLRGDGVNTDDLARQQVRLWYARVLATASPEYLPTEDVTAEAASLFHVDGESLVARIEYGNTLLAPVEVKLSGWAAPLAIFHRADSPMALQQNEVFSRAGSVAPVGVIHHNALMLYTAATSADTLEYAAFVVRPASGMYSFKAAALDLWKSC